VFAEGVETLEELDFLDLRDFVEEEGFILVGYCVLPSLPGSSEPAFPEIIYSKLLNRIGRKMDPLNRMVFGPIRRDFIKIRSCARFLVSSAVEAIDPNADIRIVGWLSDISRDGCYVNTICPFGVEAAIKLEIMRDKQTIKTEATVVYSQVGMGMGLVFTAADPENVRLLLRWLSELGGTDQGETDLANAELDVWETPKWMDQSCSSNAKPRNAEIMFRGAGSRS
jgi:hypothetical protein